MPVPLPDRRQERTPHLEARPEPLPAHVLARQAEEGLDARLKSLKKLKTVVSGGRKKLEKQPGSQKLLEKLLKDLEALAGPDAAPEAATLSSQIREQLQERSGQFERRFRDGLRGEAEKVGLEVGVFGDGLTLGPFGLTLDLKKETATLTYGKSPVEEKLPLDAARIAGRGAALAAELLAPPSDLPLLAAELEEAVRVAAVRERRPAGVEDLRAELPAVHREMCFLRQIKTRPLTKATVLEYPITRFVVEIKTLVQSDQNMSADRRFRLETAVIENTRNAKKSVYVPADLAKGYGEGTYFQAIVLTGAP